MFRKKTRPGDIVLITGASSGFGNACARHLSQKGYRVYGTSRRASFPPETIRQHADAPGFHLIPMDVRDQDSVNAGVAFILEQAGRIDALINNAGFVMAGAVEDLSIEEVNSQFATNFFGILRVCRAVLPQMRERRSGRIINISSLGGMMGVPFHGAYSASKFALEGISESLRIEVKPFGIHVTLIEPGDFRTSATKNRVFAAKPAAESVYADACGPAVAIMANDEQNGQPPEKLAVLVEKIIRHPKPKVRYSIGRMDQRFSLIAKRLLPAGLFEQMLMNYYKLG
ncbi:MAG: SDR family oxidoreductase [Desulfosalsimonadaceae bacterium]|nr:SDR family oxidoreductase [Desulfosalsimonadaceae bacterium]